MASRRWRATATSPSSSPTTASRRSPRPETSRRSSRRASNRQEHSRPRPGDRETRRLPRRSLLVFDRFRRPMRAAPLRAVILAFALALLPALTPAPAGAIHLETIETADLRLVYPGPTLGFLAPYAAQCFENSMRFHRRLF